MRQKGFVLLPALLIVVLLGIVGYFAYRNGQLRLDNNPASPSIIPTVNIPGSPTEIKTYTDEEYHFSLKYPSSWEVFEYNPIKDIHETNIQKGAYKIQIIRYIASEPCYFNDYKPPEKPSNPYHLRTTYDTYRTIDNPSYLMRRAIMSKDLNNDQNIWMVCIFNNSTKSFSTSPLNHNPVISAIWYYTPKNPDGSTVKTQDQILSTFKFTQ